MEIRLLNTKWIQCQRIVIDRLCACILQFDSLHPLRCVFYEADRHDVRVPLMSHQSRGMSDLKVSTTQ